MKEKVRQELESYEFEQEHRISHPSSQSWGTVRITSIHLNQSGGEIVLKAGVHIRYKKGFGVRHIWKAHGIELIKQGYKSIYDVPNYIAKIITHRATVLCEFKNIDNKPETLVVMKSRAGCVVLEPRAIKGNPDNLEYSVVTAYPGKKAQGQAVGNVET